MTLSGNIESFPLSEVLRLASRARQTGLLRVESGGSHGRVYFREGLLTYATTRDQDDLGGDLSQLGLIDPHKWYPVERGEEPIASALVDGKSDDDVRKFLTERVGDVLVRLLRPRHGSFDFSEGVESPFLTGQQFDVEDVLRGVEVLVQEWADIEATIPVSDATIHICHDIGDRGEVTVDATTWRIIAALTGENTVDGVADATGLSDFVVAKTMAALVRQGLLEVRTVERQPEPVMTEPIGVQSTDPPSPFEQAFASDPTPEEGDEGGTVEIFRRPGDRSGTDGW